VPPKLPLFCLLSIADELTAPGDLVDESSHDRVDARLRTFKIGGGNIIWTIWNGRLHEVISQTPFEHEEKAIARNQSLFEHYGEGHEFHEILDNGFGKTYRRADQQRYALWSYTMDFTTIGTMEFHQVKWK
jgi:hypothetical protein